MQKAIRQAAIKVGFHKIVGPLHSETDGSTNKL
jgi:hypothetical protein